VSVLRDVALLILALEGATLVLVVLVVMGVVNYVLLRFRWWHRVPRWLALVRYYLRVGQRAVERTCHVATTPFVAATTVRATFAQRVRGLLGAGGERRRG
jgi:hypothetical protein